MNLKSIGLENVRCFQKPTRFEVKPITILVGKNSSGKSTLSRLFPLLRQSFAKSTKGPILWYGEYVDFGSIESIRNADSENEDIKLLLKVEIQGSKRSRFHLNYHGYSKGPLHIAESTVIDVELTISHSKLYDHSYCKSYKISFANNYIQVVFRDVTWIESIDINGTVTKYAPDDNVTAFGVEGTFLPSVAYARRVKPQGEKARLEWHEPQFEQTLIDYIRSRTHPSLSIEKIRGLISVFGVGRDSQLIKSLKSFYSDAITLRGFANSLSPNHRSFEYIKKGYFRTYLSDLVQEVNTTLAEQFRKVKYVKPIRATASRYYRNQEFSVAEIDADGANIAMYIDSLDSPREYSLNEFLKSNLGVEVRCNKSGGHLALMVKETSSDAHINIADMGFGYSQVLPIMVQTWAANYGDSPSLSRGESHGDDMILVIEQPELHLHPDFQARLANVFAGFANNSPNSCVVLETHSPHIINRLGELISQGELDSSKVNVVLVDHEGSTSNLREIDFNEDGVLQKWPFGFFEPN